MAGNSLVTRPLHRRSRESGNPGLGWKARSDGKLIVFTLLIAVWGASHAQDTPTTSAGKRQIDFALGLYQRGDYREAVAEFDVYLKNSDWKDRRDLALFFSGEANGKLGNPQAALTSYEVLLGEFSDSEYRTISSYRSAGLHIELRQGEQALQVLEPLVRENLPPHLETGVWYSLGAAYSLVEESTRSLSWWKRVVEKTPDSTEGRRALVGMGFEAARIERYEEAVESLEAWLREPGAIENPTYPEALKCLAECEERLGKNEVALNHWISLSKIESAPSFREDGIANGLRVSFDLSDWKIFERLSERAESLLVVPRNRIDWRILEGARAYEEKKWRLALDRYGEALREAETLPEEEASALAGAMDPLRIRSAWCAFALADWEAVEILSGGLSESSRSTDAIRYLTGEAARNLGKYKEAQERLSQVADDSEFKQEARIGEADAAFQGEGWKEAARLYEELAQRMGEGEESAIYFLRASQARRGMEDWVAGAVLAASATRLARTPAVRENGLYLQGWLYSRAGHFPKAIRAFGELTTEYPHSKRTPETLALLGQAHRRIGDPTRESEVLERLVEDFPENEWSADSLLRLAAAYSARSDRAGILNALLRYQSRYPQSPLHPDYAIWLAEELVESGSGEAAAAAIEVLLSQELAPAEKEKCGFLLGAAFELSEDWEKSLEVYEPFLSEYPESRYRLACLVGAAACAKGLGNADLAGSRVKEGLDLLAQEGGYEPEVESRLYLLAGDLAFEKEDFQTAYRYYARPSILYRHPKWTPLALEKSALCKDRLGETEKARELRDEIAKEFPRYGMEIR